MVEKKNIVFLRCHLSLKLKIFEANIYVSQLDPVPLSALKESHCAYFRATIGASVESFLTHKPEFINSVSLQEILTVRKSNLYLYKVIGK
ncbi:hypothetical protein BH11BAC1_BH11BAC1_12670 [soil metagenome]